MNRAALVSQYRCDVVIVDDYESLADLLAFTIEESGLTVRVALDGKSALEIASGCTPRVAVVDCMLPDMEGIELVRMLRATWSDTEFILMSGNIGGVSADLAKRLGIRAFLNKPVPPRGLCRAVHRLLDMPRSPKPVGGSRYNWISLGIGSPAHDESETPGRVARIPLAPRADGLR